MANDEVIRFRTTEFLKSAFDELGDYLNSRTISDSFKIVLGEWAKREVDFQNHTHCMKQILIQEIEEGKRDSFTKEGLEILKKEQKEAKEKFDKIMRIYLFTITENLEDLQQKMKEGLLK